MSTRGGDKASRYTEQLNIARLRGNWVEVKEYARKLAKHASNQQDLLLIANTEAEFPYDTKFARLGGKDDRLSQAAANLRQVLQSRKDEKQQGGSLALAARANLGCILLKLEEWQEAIQVTSKDHWDETLDDHGSAMSPLDVLSVLKCVCALGTAQLQTDAQAAAEDTFQAGLSVIKQANKAVFEHQETSKWALRISTQSTLIAQGHSGAGIMTIEEMNKDLLKYRSWSQFSDSKSSNLAPGTSAASIWEAYYSLVSTILRSNMAYLGSEKSQAPLDVWQSTLPRQKLTSARVKQFAELQKVERAYEQILGKTTAFPAAKESNTTYESFVDLVLTNWRVIMSSEWTDADLGKGGKSAYSRSVLEVLYRASSKTFHSTPVLRHLFTVHAQLGDFDLAIKAFDSYVEIVSKGKARAEKSGKYEAGLDTDDIVLETAAKAVRILCLYGERKEAEKAFELGELIASWLRQRRRRSSSSALKDMDPAVAHQVAAAESFSPIPARAAAYRAIGQSQAVWARYAYESTTRKELQQEAIGSLRHSKSLSAPHGEDLETAYLLAYTLAENRQPSAAINIVKRALASQVSYISARVLPDEAEEAFEAIRQRLPLWHILVLILSAMSEYDAALSTCETAIELLISTALKCEVGSVSNGVNGDVIAPALPQRITDGLDDAEKEVFLQLKMTELELLVLTDNLAYGANRQRALIMTYKELFGDPGEAPQPRQENVGVATLPKSRAGTVKSFRQSMFGRPKTARKSLDHTTFEKPPPLPLPSMSPELTKSPSINPPSVTVTDTDVVNGTEQTTNGTNLSIRGRSGPVPDDPFIERAPDMQQDHKDSAAPADGLASQQIAVTDMAVVAESEPIPVKQTVDANEEKTQMEVKSDLHIVPVSSFMASTMTPSFPPLARTRHQLTVLISIWLFLSKHYLPDNTTDASAAVQEAQRLIEILQSATAAVSPGGPAWLLRGGGLGASIAQLQGDVLAQRGAIALITRGPHAALQTWEKALLWVPDHETALPGLANVLLDIHEGKLPIDEPVAGALDTAAPPDDEQDALTRLSCRDRAYMLCSTATKGPLWDRPEPWFLLGRSWEVVGHADKAAECYWWVVELEDSQPVRNWSCAGPGP